MNEFQEKVTKYTELKKNKDLQNPKNTEQEQFFQENSLKPARSWNSK